MIYDYSKLNGKIREVFGTQAKFALAMGLSERSLSIKMNSLRPWKQSEIILACTLLDIPIDSIGAYFFTTKVQRN